MASLKGTGTNDKKRVAILGALGFVVLVLAAKTLFGGPDATPPQAVPVRPASIAGAQAHTRSATAAGFGSGANPAAGPMSFDPALHPELMAENENYLYAGSGRNIFSKSANVAPVAPVKIEKVQGPVRPSMVQTAAQAGPPPPPNIDLRFFGYAARKNGTRKAFLLHGEDVFVASEGDVVSHRYRVVHIGPLSVEVEDLPYHNTQTLPLIQN